MHRLNPRFVRLSVIFLLSLLFASPAFAQLGIAIDMNHKAYLQYENISARITLRNFSGHPLIFGESEQLQGKIRFEITSPDGSFIPLSGNQTPCITGMLIEPGKTKQVVIPVSQFYRLIDIGRYTIRAYITHPQLASAFESGTANFTISNGMPVWEHQVGLPRLIDTPDTTEQIQQRYFRISSLLDGNRNYFYLIIDDEDQIYCIRRIGIEMSKSAPNCEVDHLSRLHIMVQTNPRVFSYYIFNPDGSVDKESVYRKTTSTPQLIRNQETGTVVLVGGAEARENIDYEKTEDKPFEEQKNDNTSIQDGKNIKPAAPKKSFSEKEKETDKNKKTNKSAKTVDAESAQPAPAEGDLIIENNTKALEDQPETKDAEIKKKKSIWSFLDFSGSGKKDAKKKAVKKTEESDTEAESDKAVSNAETAKSQSETSGEKKKSSSFWDFLPESSSSSKKKASTEPATETKSEATETKVETKPETTTEVKDSKSTETKEKSFWDWL